MKHINNETCKWMRVNGELVPFSSEIPDTSNGNVIVKYYLKDNLQSLEGEFEGNDYVHKVSLANMNVSGLKSLKNMLYDCSSLTELEYNKNISENVDCSNLCNVNVEIINATSNQLAYITIQGLQDYLLSDTSYNEYTMMNNISITYSLNVKGNKVINLNSYTLSNKPAGVPMFNLTEPSASIKLNYPPGKLDWSILTQGTSSNPDYKVVWTAGTKTLSLSEKSELDKFKEFLSSGKGTYKLNEDITTTTMLYPSVNNLTIDLNGHSIINGTIKSSVLNDNFILLQVPQGRTLTIKDSVGTGKVDGGGKLNRKSSVAVKVQDNSTLNIEGGYFFVDVPETGGANSCIYVESGTANISGGKFESTGSNSNGIHYVLNMLDNSNSNIVVTGGEFVDFDPSKPMTEPDKELSFVKSGYKVNQNGNIYEVVK